MFHPPVPPFKDQDFSPSPCRAKGPRCAKGLPGDAQGCQTGLCMVWRACQRDRRALGGLPGACQRLKYSSTFLRGIHATPDAGDES